MFQESILADGIQIVKTQNAQINLKFHIKKSYNTKLQFDNNPLTIVLIVKVFDLASQ